MHNSATRERNLVQAFTLIELSIVLVIIGLLVGGVLVGKDLIYAASMRATISQKDRLDVAFSTFKLKYNGLPGDLRTPSQFGLPGGDGGADGVIHTYGNALTQKWAWQQLYEAGLTQNEYDDRSTSPYVVSSNYLPGIYSPTCKLCIQRILSTTEKAGGWYVSDLGSIGSSWNCKIWPELPAGFTPPTYRALLLITSNLQGAGWGPAEGGTIYAPDARAIDLKVDDGKPYSGTVQVSGAYMYSDSACSGNNSLPAFNRAFNATDSLANQYPAPSSFDANVNLNMYFKSSF